MGFSRGGQAILYASMKRLQKMHGPADASFAAYIPFYANCGTTYVDDENLADKPIRIFHGSADDYVPVAPCRSYVERLRKAGKDVVLTEYPDAHHVFDGANFQPPLRSAQAQTTPRCRVEEIAEGELVNGETRQRFTMEDACVERGPTIAYHPEAHKASVQAVKEFLRTALKLMSIGDADARRHRAITTAVADPRRDRGGRGRRPAADARTKRSTALASLCARGRR